MTITNGYATLEEAREQILNTAQRRQAATIAFVAATKKITDSAKGLRFFPTGARIRVQGSTSNDGYYTVVTGDVAGEIVVSESLTDEAVGDTVTITNVTDVEDDLKIEDLVTAASRAIEKHCRRRFWKNSSDETRYYTAFDGETLFPEDDIVSITSLLTDEDGDRTYEVTWATTDYDLLPYNASLDGWPYTWIETTPEGDYTFPTVKKGVKITGVFGFSSVPAEVKQACLLLCERFVARHNAPLGLSGNAEFGMMKILKEDPDVANLLGVEPGEKFVRGGF